MAVLLDPLDTAGQLDGALLIAGQREALVANGHQLLGIPALLLGRQGTLETGQGEGIDLATRNAIAAGQVLRGGDHVDTRRRIKQGFPEKVLELNRRAQAKTAAVGVGGDGIARHRLGGHAQGQFGAAGDFHAGLAQQLETGSADPLHRQGRHRLRHTAVQADVARQHIGIEAGLGHGAG